jgi:hypothetical protein
MPLTWTQWHDIRIKFDDCRFRLLSNSYSRKNLRGCNVGIIDHKDYDVIRCDGVIWHDVHTKFK